MSTGDTFLVLSAFLACGVEMVEALTIVLAAGVARGWRSALIGLAAATVTLAVIVAALGPALTQIPLQALRLVVGALLLVFGLQWLRKAILRASGYKALHDEDAIFARELAEARGAAQDERVGIDWYGFTLAFKGVLLEGLEVVFIVLTFGSAQGSIPLAAAESTASGQPGFVAPDLTDQSIMLVAPQSIETSLIARRLQRWGGQTCMVSDLAAARALLPERAWHAVLLDHAFGASEVAALGEAARIHATQRIVTFTPATRHELQASASAAFTGYLIKPLRAASLAARLTMAPEVPSPNLAGDGLIDMPDNVAAPAIAPARGLSILVAEDNEINALLMRSLLTRLGHLAVITTNGEEALESWLAAKSAGAPYDLVLMDIQMPQLDGIETARRIRELEAGEPGRQTPILALTANTLVADRYACFEAGMDGFLIKPLDHEKLTDALAGLAASRHLAA